MTQDNDIEPFFDECFLGFQDLCILLARFLSYYFSTIYPSWLNGGTLTCCDKIILISGYSPVGSLPSTQSFDSPYRESALVISTPKATGQRRNQDISPWPHGQTQCLHSNTDDLLANLATTKEQTYNFGAYVIEQTICSRFLQIFR